MATKQKYDPLTGLRRNVARTLGMVPDQGGLPDFTPQPVAAPPSPGIAPGASPAAGGFDYAQLGIPGQPFDYLQAIRDDPFYRQTVADLNAAGIQSQGQRDTAWQRALINYGVVPDVDQAARALGLSPDQLRGFLTPELVNLIESSTRGGVSVASRMQQQYRRNVQNMLDQLANRGMLRSSAPSILFGTSDPSRAGEGGGQVGQEFQQGMYGATQELLNTLAGANAAYVDYQRQLASERGRAGQEAAGRVPEESIVNQPPMQATLSDYDSTGTPVYTTPDGRTWTLGPGGNAVPYTPVRAAQPSPPASGQFTGQGAAGGFAARPM